MSTNNKKVIEIETISLNKEDLAIIDSIIGQFPHKTVDPIYQVIRKRMEEAAQVILSQQQAQVKDLKSVPEVATEAMPK